MHFSLRFQSCETRLSWHTIPFRLGRFTKASLLKLHFGNLSATVLARLARAGPLICGAGFLGVEGGRHSSKSINKPSKFSTHQHQNTLERKPRQKLIRKLHHFRPKQSPSRHEHRPKASPIPLNRLSTLVSPRNTFAQPQISTKMAGGKGKSAGGKSSGGKTSGDLPKKQQSHSARAGLQVSSRPPNHALYFFCLFIPRQPEHIAC